MSAPRLAGVSVSGQAERIGHEDHQRAGGLGLLDRRRVVAIDAEGVGPGDDQRRGVVVDGLAVDLDAERFGAGAHDVEDLRMQRTGERRSRLRLSR